MSKVRLLAFDIDGTLSPAGQPIAPKVLDSLRACAAAGVLLVPATGRKFTSIARLCTELGLSGPAITCNGAITVEAGSRRVMARGFMGRDLYLQVLQTIGADPRFSLAIFTATDIVCDGNTFAHRTLEGIGETIDRIAPALDSLASEDIAKVLAATAAEADLHAAYQEYAARFAGICSVTTTSREFLEFMAPGISKGAALARIAVERGISTEQIACIGDSDNDLSMFEVAGLGIAVADATPRVLAAAGAVVPSARQAGVTQAVRRYILS
jgi:Cof subfamily protein (haloacid dehalogenase superfamily)